MKTKLFWIKESIVALLILLFAYTAFSKFIEYDIFVFQLQLVPLPLMGEIAPTLGWMVPLVESLIVIALIISKWRTIGLYSSLLLLFIFEGYISILLLSGYDLPCTCGGIISKMGWKEHLIFNAIFILLTVFALYFNKEKQQNSLQLKKSIQ